MRRANKSLGVPECQSGDPAVDNSVTEFQV